MHTASLLRQTARTARASTARTAFPVAVGAVTRARFFATSPSTSDRLGAGANPLKPSGVGRGMHTSAVARGGKPVGEQSAQHPGKSDIDHLENPSLSEEFVHADRDAADPLKGKKGSKGAVGGAAASATTNATEQAKGVAGKVADAVKGAASTVADAVGAGQKRGYHASAVRAAPGGKPVEEQSAQHPGKSGHDHLDNPSLSEEGVHADRSPKDPLPDQHKASTKKETGKGAVKNKA
ncbi:hypothetical protein JCM3770_002372 [Rhodotorula araucariae]